VGDNGWQVGVQERLTASQGDMLTIRRNRRRGRCGREPLSLVTA
jgi:hypothetical protein